MRSLPVCLLTVTLLLGIFCHTAFAQQPEPAWVWVAEMEQPPAAGGWIGKTCTARVEDGVLRVLDASSERGEAYCMQLPWEAEPDQEAMVEARLKVVSSEGDAGVALWVSNGVHEEGIQFHAGGFDLAFAKLRHTMDTTDDFHVYRVSIKDQSVRISVDGKLVVDGTGKLTHPAHQGRNEMSFGSCSSTAKGESLWDYVRVVTPMRPEPIRRPATMEHVTLYKRPDVYAVFPSLQIEAATGKLSTGFRAGGPRSHIDAQGAGSATMVSEDGGKTWNPGAGIPQPAFRGADGRQVRLGCKWWQEYPAAEREALEKQGYYVADVREGVVAICAGVYQSWSEDAGQTWHTEDISVPFTATLASGMNSLQLPDGTILFPVYGARTAGGADCSWMLRSADGGKTWQFVEVGTPPDGKTHLNEPEILSLDGDRLLVAMRTGVGADHLWTARSDDRGATWHDLRDTEVKGHPPDLLKLEDGRILLTYGYRHPPYGIRAAVSDDEGRTWKPENVWTLRDDGGGTDLGYPHSVQLADGTVVTVYYFMEPGGMQYIACTRWVVPR